MSRTVVLTGGTGLIGAHLIRALGESDTVHAVGRSGIGGHPDAVPVAMDLRHPIEAARLPVAADAVVHLAQSSRFRDFPGGAADMVAVNVTRTIELASYAVAAGARTFVYASTGGVYGTGRAPFREADPPSDTLGFYPASKLAAEQLLRPFAPLLTVVILRFFFVYGSGQKREMLVPRLVDSVRDGRPITLQGPNGITINPLHAGDAAAAVAAALTLTHSATINVGGPEALSLRAMALTIGAATGGTPRFEVQPDVTPGDLEGDIALQTMLLGAPATRFADGVQDAL